MRMQQSTQHLVRLSLKGIAVAMAVAVVVLSTLHAATTETLISLLGLGLVGLAIASLQKGE